MASRFEQFALSLMDEYLSWEPAYATQLGWHKYDHVLKDLSPEAHASQADRCDQLIRQLEATSVRSLPADDALDRDLAIHLLELRRFESGTLRLFEREAVACNELGYSLFLLFCRDKPSLDARMESIIARIEAAPRFLEKSKKGVTRPLRLWNEAAHEVCSELPAFIKTIEESADKWNLSKGQSRRLHDAVRECIPAIEQHNDWVAKDIIPSSSNEIAILPEEYSQYFQLRGYGVTASEALDIGEIYMPLCKDSISAIAKSVVPSGDFEKAIDLMKSDHPPTFAAVIEEYREAVSKARDFVVKHEVCAVPPNEKLLVIETPQFMRPIYSSAGQFEPGRFDDDRTGLFVVTPDESNPMLLREHSRIGIINTSVHEGYPGHHLQGICSNQNPSYIRAVVMSPDFSEGWALYTEEMMISRGHNDTALGRLAMLNDMLFRIVRLIVEVKLAMGEMTLEEGANMLERECSIEPKSAKIEARACAMSPTYFSSYFIGKLAMLQLREDAERAMGPRFSLKFFHDALLGAGCMPMSFMRRALEIRLRDDYDIELGQQREKLHEYAVRKARSPAL